MILVELPVATAAYLALLVLLRAVTLGELKELVSSPSAAADPGHPSRVAPPS